jgi:hypothetical protein
MPSATVYKKITLKTDELPKPLAAENVNVWKSSPR